MKKLVVLAISLAMICGSVSALAGTPTADEKAAVKTKNLEIVACKKVAKESYQSKLVNIEKIRKDFTKTQQEKMGEAVKAAQVVYKAAVKQAQENFAAAKKAAQETYNSALDTAKTTMRSNTDEYKNEYNTAAAACTAR